MTKESLSVCLSVCHGLCCKTIHATRRSIDWIVGRSVMFEKSQSVSLTVSIGAINAVVEGKCFHLDCEVS